MPLSLLLPLGAVTFIVVWGGGLGALFLALSHTALKEWGAVIVGLILVLGVPAAAALLTMRRSEEKRR